jgi:hypothetical protein
MSATITRSNAVGVDETPHRVVSKDCRPHRRSPVGRRASAPMTLDPFSNEPPPVVPGVTSSARESNASLHEGHGAGWAQFKRLTQIGLPRRFPIVQFPNAPLILAFLAGVIASHVHGPSHSYATAAAYLAMTVWAYDELARGVNWFRRLLGLAYMVITIVRVAHGLQA